MCVLRHTCHPAPCAPQAHPEGNPRIGHPHGPLPRSAPSRGRKRHALRRRGRAQQWPVWPFGCWMFGCPTPCWLRLRRGGCGVSMRVEARMPRELTRRGCPSGARQRKASSTAHPATAPTQVAPSHREGVADWGSPFFWVLFFGEAKNKYLGRRGESRLPP